MYGAFALPFSRTIISSSFQRNAFQLTAAKLTIPRCAAFNSSSKTCLSLQPIAKVAEVKPVAQIFRLFRDVFNPLSQRRLCSSATKEQKCTEEKATVPKKTEISYDELLAFVKSEGKYIYDVRDPAEVEETGMIQNAINIPLTKLKSSMLMTDAEFQETYKVKKPALEESAMMVFYGLSSVKSSAALEIVQKMGYKKARHYPGGYEEWKQKEAGNK